MQYVWGIRYIDDIALRRQDTNKDGDYIDTDDKNYYHCTDAMFSTVCVLNSTDAKVLERVSYDAYGKARHHRAADMNADGRVNNSDYLVVVGGWGSFPNQGDVNRDGLVNASDSNAVVADWGSGLAPGKLSTTDNVIGWDGYVFNAEVGEGGLYTVRHRSYKPELGRWVEADPIATLPSNPMADVLQMLDSADLLWLQTIIEFTFDPSERYAEGRSLYQYGPSNSLSGLDPAGGPWWFLPITQPIKKRIAGPIGGAIGGAIGKAIGERYAKKLGKRIAEFQKKRLKCKAQKEACDVLAQVRAVQCCEPVQGGGDPDTTCPNPIWIKCIDAHERFFRSRCEAAEAACRRTKNGTFTMPSMPCFSMN